MAIIKISPSTPAETIYMNTDNIQYWKVAGGPPNYQVQITDILGATYNLATFYATISDAEAAIVTINAKITRVHIVDLTAF